MARNPPRTLLWAVAVAALAAGPVPGAEAQLPVPCLDCQVVLETLEWNGTGLPGMAVGGLFRINNTGQMSDSYTVTATTDNETWEVAVDTAAFEDVPAGGGLLGSDESTREFEVRVVVPQTAPAGASAAVTISVDSEASDATDSTNAVAAASQVYGWTLTCTEALEVRKTTNGKINLTARNTGNGPDTATITLVAPPDGIVATDTDPMQAPADANRTQTVDIGVGLSVPDSDYALRWDLRSRGEPTRPAVPCTTTLTVTGGGEGPTDEPEDEGRDSAALSFAPPLAAGLALLVAARRRRR